VVPAHRRGEREAVVEGGGRRGGGQVDRGHRGGDQGKGEQGTADHGSPHRVAAGQESCSCHCWLAPPLAGQPITAAICAVEAPVAVAGPLTSMFGPLLWLTGAYVARGTGTGTSVHFWSGTLAGVAWITAAPSAVEPPLTPVARLALRPYTWNVPSPLGRSCHC